MNPLSVCLVCKLVWCLAVVGATGYLVFGLGHSGWWFVLAIMLCSGEYEVNSK